MQNKLRIPTHDNQEFSGYTAYPETAYKTPGVIVIQEIFGVNANVRAICNNLSQAGYVAMAPDIFWRQKPGVELDDKIDADWKQAMEYFNGFNVDLGIQDLKSALKFLRKDDKCTGRVGTVGFCLGGKLAYLMGTRSDADCNVSYYGVGIQDMLGEARNITKPLLMHIAEKDKYVPPEAQKDILGELRGKKFVDVQVYPDVDHAFARSGGTHYNKAAAQLANYMTADFLSAHLAG